MSAREDGSAGLPFINDVMKILKDQWIDSNTKRPTFDKVWDEKILGLGNRKFRSALVTLDTESIQIFSLQQRNAGVPFWDWLHDVSLTIEVRTSTTAEDALTISSEIIRILKKNVLLNINGNEYVQMLPGTAEAHHEEFRGLFRYDIDCSALRYNP